MFGACFVCDLVGCTFELVCFGGVGEMWCSGLGGSVWLRFRWLGLVEIWWVDVADCCCLVGEERFG